MVYGTVAWFDPERGIGAITIEGSGTEVPVTSTHIDGGGRQSLQENAHVAFTLLDGPDGPRAADVFSP